MKWEEKNPRRVYVEVRPAAVRPAAQALFKDLGFRFSIATGMETLEGFQVLYHFSLDRTGLVLSLRVRLGKENPETDSIADLVPAADWIEREMAELLGIKFRGRPSTERLLSDDEWEEKEYPLRKDRVKKDDM
ncbi:MAG: NADH-quinone oxidoreductase subunit C [Candidatus Aureabacteria bacterium]|nr:NADH-quinone oxidoreductase subunit C [Candidatus Auribacterota bacterium]